MKNLTAGIASVLALVGMALPVAVRVVDAPVDDKVDPLDMVGMATSTPLSWLDAPAFVIILAGIVVVCLAATLFLRPERRADATITITAAIAGLTIPFCLFREGVTVGSGAWMVLGASLVALTNGLNRLAEEDSFARKLVVPALFGAAVIVLWEIAVRGFDVPLILLPPPSLVAATLFEQWALLASDFVQTILRSALSGYAIGCATGFALAVACDRFPFLTKGLLPYANLVSAIPMVGIAPIMIMWFGFGWQSKAAVVVVVTVFPMLVNTLAGLAATDRIQLDLMRSYAAGYWRTLVQIRLPNALPFVFNVLKVNSTFALISAIVAEFFGTPITGMGFRISTEVARMNLSMVWATIVVAALTGSVVYGGLALIERAVTSWHPSYQKR